MGHGISKGDHVFIFRVFRWYADTTYDQDGKVECSKPGEHLLADESSFLAVEVVQREVVLKLTKRGLDAPPDGVKIFDYGAREFHSWEIR